MFHLGLVLGTDKVESIPIKEMRVGELRFPSQRIYYVQGSASAPNILGLDVLSQSDFVLDYPAHKLYLKRSLDQTNPSYLVNQYRQVGDMKVYKKPKQAQWFVNGLAGAGPFAAGGVRVGDILLTITKWKADSIG